MARPKDPTYFLIPSPNSDWKQSVPVGWYMRKRLKRGHKGDRVQVIAISVEAIAGWIRAMQKVNAPKTLYPLIQAIDERYGEARVSKHGTPMRSSLVFMDFDGPVSEAHFQLLQQMFDQEQMGCTFRTFSEERAKVAFVVRGTPSHEILSDFILKTFYQTQLHQAGLPYPDRSPQALITSFIPSEAVLWHLTHYLPTLRIHNAEAFCATHGLPDAAELASLRGELVIPQPPIPLWHNPSPIQAAPSESDILDEAEAWLAEQVDPNLLDDGDEIEVIPYTPTVDPVWIEANVDGNAEISVSRLDTIPAGKGWARGWIDYEGPLPEWLMDRRCLGDQAIDPRSVDGKLLRWLFGSAKALCETGVDIPQKDVAEYLGVSQPAVCKSIRKFVERGWLTLIPHHFEVGPNTSLEALGKIDGLRWDPVVGEGGELIGIAIHGHWSYKRSQLITAAMGFLVGPKALKYMTLDLALRFACLQILRAQGQKRTIEEVEQLLGPPECYSIDPGHWNEGLWKLMLTGHFQEAEVWFDYCSRIPGIHDPANTPRIRKLHAIWSWVEQHWLGVREGQAE